MSLDVVPMTENKGYDLVRELDVKSKSGHIMKMGKLMDLGLTPDFLLQLEVEAGFTTEEVIDRIVAGKKLEPNEEILLSLNQINGIEDAIEGYSQRIDSVRVA